MAWTVGRGAAVYTPKSLRFYDFIVLFLSNRWLWKCPTGIQLAFYNQFLSANHLDVGVGSGYYLAHCDLRSGQRLALLDLDPHCLEYAKARLAGRPVELETRVADVLAPIDWDKARFDSIALFFLLHCVPGAMVEKALALDHLAALLNPSGTLYGATILGCGT